MGIDVDPEVIPSLLVTFDVAVFVGPVSFFLIDEHAEVFVGFKSHLVIAHDSVLACP